MFVNNNDFIFFVIFEVNHIFTIKVKTAAHIVLTPTSKKLPDSKIFFIGTGYFKSLIENPLTTVKKNLKVLIQTTIEYSTTNFPVSQLSKLICLKLFLIAY